MSLQATIYLSKQFCPKGQSLYDINASAYRQSTLLTLFLLFLYFSAHFTQFNKPFFRCRHTTSPSHNLQKN
ncbi:hypothetical protein Tco_1573891, partial [Tanacetum coccineum]